MPQKKVVDPAILAQLEGEDSGAKKVTDPALLAQLEGNNTPVQEPAPVQPSLVSPPAQSNSEILGIPEQKEKYPLMPKLDPEVERKQSIIQRTNQAISGHAKDLLELHPEGAAAGPVSDPAHVLNSSTDPMGDPAVTGRSLVDMKTKLEQERDSQLRNLDLVGVQTSSNYSKRLEIKDYYDKRIKQVEDNAHPIVALKVFNQENAKQGHAVTADQADVAIKNIDQTEKKLLKDNEAKYNVGSSAQSEMTVTDRKILDSERQRIKENADRERAKIRINLPWDDTRLGIDYYAAIGDRQAIADKANLANGMPPTGANKYRYDVKGGEVKKIGHENADATELTNIAANAAPHLQTPESLEAKNKNYLIQKRTDDIGNVILRNKNPFKQVFNALIPTGAPSEKNIKEAADQLGITPEQLKEINRDEIKTQATLAGQFAKGFEGGVASTYKNIGGATIGKLMPNGQWEELHQPGWEENRGLNIFGQNAPSAQNEGWLGVVGHAAEGAGSLGEFVGEVGGLAKGIGALRLGTKTLTAAEAEALKVSDPALYETAAKAGAKLAEKTEHYATNMKMFMDGYNSAHEKSFDVIGKGDSAEDEAKRKLYSATNAFFTTALFSISPKTKIIGNILEGSKPEIKEVINRIANEGAAAFENPETKDIITKMVSEAIKEDGKQVGLATAAQLVTNVENMIAGDKNKYHPGDELQETAMSTAVAMSLPSIVSGIAQGRRLSPVNRDLAIEIGSDPNKYTDAVNRLRDAGQISEADLQRSLAAIGQMQSAVRNAPGEHPTTGRKLTETQQRDFAGLELKRNLLTEKKTALEKRKASDVEIGEVSTAIKDVEKSQKEILDAAAKEPEIVLPERTANESRQELAETSLNTQNENETKADIDKEFIAKKVSQLKEQYSDENGVVSDEGKRRIAEVENDPQKEINEDMNYLQRELNSTSSEDNKRYLEGAINEHNDYKERYAAAKSRESADNKPTIEPAQEKAATSEEKKVAENKEEPVTLDPEDKVTQKTENHGQEISSQKGTDEKSVSTEKGDAKEKGSDAQGQGLRQDVVEEKKRESEVEQVAGEKPEQPVLVEDKEPVKYEDAIALTSDVNKEGLPEGDTEEIREIRSNMIRNRDNNPAEYTKHEIGTYAVDKYGELHQLQSIPISDLIQREKGNPTSGIVDKYAEWIKQTGDMPPIKGVENFAVHNGKVVVTDGHHRIAAAEKAGLKEVPVWVALTDPRKITRPLTDADVAYHRSLGAKVKDTATEAPPAKKSRSERLKEAAKTEEHAIKQSEEPKQEVIEPSSIEEHAPVEQTGGEVEKPSAESGDSDKRSQEEKIAEHYQSAKDSHTEVSKAGTKRYRLKKIGERVKKIREQMSKMTPESEEYKALNLELQGKEKYFNEQQAKKPAGSAIRTAGMRSGKEKINSIPKEFEPLTYEEEVLYMLANGQKFEHPGFDESGRPKGVLKDINLSSEEGKTAEASYFGKPNEKRTTIRKEDGTSKEFVLNSTDEGQYGSELQQKWSEENNGNTSGFIAEVMYNYPTRAKAAEKLLEIINERNAQQQLLEGPANVYQIKTPSGETIELDSTHPDFEEHIAEVYGYKEALDHITDEEHPLYKSLYDTEVAINENKATEEDYDKLSALIDKFTKEDGELDVEGITRSLNELSAELSRPAQELVKKILPFSSEEENKKEIENLKEKIKEYGTKNNERGISQPTEEGKGKRSIKSDSEAPSGEGAPTKRETKTRKRLNALADKIEKQYAENKEKHKGSVLSAPGISLKLGDKVADFVVAKLVRGLRELGNLHVAIHEALDAAKKEFPGKEDQDNLKAITVQEIRKSLPFEPPPLMEEPKFKRNEANRKEVAESILDDIQSGELSKDEAINEVLAEDISSEMKSDIINYIEWGYERIDRQEQVQNAIQAENPFSKLELQDSGEISKYLGAHTTLDIVGNEGYYDDVNEEKTKVSVNLLAKNSYDFVNAYKTDADGKISEWGSKMMSDIKADEDNPMKQVVALSGLHGELQIERRAQEAKLDKLTSEILATAPGEKLESLKKQKAEALTEYNKTKGLIAEVQNVKKKILSKASGTLNAGRVDRMIDGNLMFEQYENAVLSKKQSKNKVEVKEVLSSTPQELAPKERSIEDEAKASQKRKEKETAPGQEKAKSAVKRVKDYIAEKAKKNQYKKAKEQAQNEFGRKANGDKKTAAEFLEELKKLKNPC